MDTPRLPSDLPAFEQVFAHQKLSGFPQDRQWEAALTYMLMCLSNQIHTVITSIRGNDLPFPDGNGGWVNKHIAWPQSRQDEELKKLETLLDKVNEITDDITEHYFPFTGSGCPSALLRFSDEDSFDPDEE